MTRKSTRTAAAGHWSSDAQPKTSTHVPDDGPNAEWGHERLIKVLDMLPDAIAVVSRTGDIIACNAAYRSLERQRDTVDGSVDCVSIDAHAERAQVEGVHQRRSKEVLSNTGRWLRISEGSTPDGELVKIYTDLSELKQREHSVRLMFESNPVPMWVHDRDSLRFVAVNEAAIIHYGYGRERFLEMTILDLLAPDAHADARKVLVDQLERSGEKVREHIRSDGSKILVSLYSRYFTYNGRPARLVAAVDVTEQRRKVDEFFHLAHHDPLTGLPNRALFKERLETALGEIALNQGKVALLFLDLDKFKAINDSLGHGAGDELLCQAADRMRLCVSGADTVARMGGDEFAIIKKFDSDWHEVSEIAEGLVSLIGQPYLIDGERLSVGASVGIAIAPVDGSGLEMLLERADQALYAAKAAGRGTFRFHSHLAHDKR